MKYYFEFIGEEEHTHGRTYIHTYTLINTKENGVIQ